MNTPGSEARLVLALALNAVVLAGAWRLARRWGSGGTVQTLLDTMLGWYLVQYLAVTLPGTFGFLSTPSMAITGLVLAVGIWLSSKPVRSAVRRDQAVHACKSVDDRVAFSSALFAVGFLAAWVYTSRFAPVTASDGLTYHLPMSIQWLQSGRLETSVNWYWNPANMFGPAASAAFQAWLLGPLQSDAIVRFAQVGALVMIFLAMLQCARGAGANSGIAGLIAASVVVSRPFFSQSVLLFDDLFVAAFFLTAVAACAPPAATDRLGPWRLGAAAGLLFATKTTALLTLPLLFLVVDAPWRAGWTWRRWIIAGGLAVALAGPWFARNLIEFANPFYPLDLHIAGIHLLHGLFTLARDTRLNSPAGVWAILTDGYFSMPPSVMEILIAGWVIALLAAGRRAWNDPMMRLAIWGTPLGLVTFIAAAPLAEIRFFFPMFLPIFIASAAAATSLPRRCLGWLAGAALLTVSTIHAFQLSLWMATASFAAAGAAAAATGWLILRWRRKSRPWPFRARLIVAGLAGLTLVLLIKLDWADYLSDCEQDAPPLWQQPYGDIAQAWLFVRDAANIPPDATIAYANTYWLDPLYGPDYARRVVYAPLRSDLHSMRDFPWLGSKIDGYRLPWIQAAILDSPADASVWRDHLRRQRARFLFVAKDELDAAPPELRFARGDPTDFQPLFENSAAEVFRIMLQ